MYADYIGPTSTIYYTVGGTTLMTVSGEYIEFTLPFAMNVTQYCFDATLNDVPSSWTLLGLSTTGIWELLDVQANVNQPLNETSYGTHLADETAERVYSFANTTAYGGYRFVVQSVTGICTNAFNLSGFSLVLNPVA